MKINQSSRIVLILFFLSSVIVLALCVYTSFMMGTISAYIYDDIEGRLLALSRYATKIITAEELAMLQNPEDMETTLFLDVKRRLVDFSIENKVLFVYYMRDVNGMAQFIIDNDLTDGSVNLASEPIPWEEIPLKALYGKASVTPLESYSEGYEGLISAFAPVLDSQGNVIALSGVDIDDHQVLTVRNTINTLSLFLFISVISVVVSGFLNVYLHSKMDAARIEALERAVQASRAKGDFLSNMSHEMRTPMNAIIGMTAIGKASNNIERKDYCLNRIEEASTHLLGVINDILDMSKIEAGKLELSLAVFSFSKMIQKVITINDFRIQEKKLSFILDLDKNIPDLLIGDDQRLSQVITNLLSNAVKFTPEGGEIRLSVLIQSLVGEFCTLCVTIKDSGIGITKEQQARLFLSFEQAESGTARKYGGTGLGLVISKRIIELMNGRIWVESEFGKGAAFTFNIHLRVAATAGESSGSAQNAEPHAQPKSDLNTGGGSEERKDIFSGFRVLVAEDIEINREIVISLFESIGLEVECAVNGANALQMFTESPDKYDIIFMDVQMPEMDGYEATQKIRALSDPRAKNIPIIAMTANVFREDIKMCLNAGMNGHVGKPLNMQDILDKLRTYLKK
ncbi:MAG: response regulator [Clostridiales bacterium]|nr:response regulator [Clostridiales bacterium]